MQMKKKETVEMMSTYRLEKQGSHWLVLDAETRRIRYSSPSALAATMMLNEYERTAARNARQIEENESVRWRGRRSGG
jgi:hypothetical protein